MKPLYLSYDNRDDRREIHQLLCKLPPSWRVRFLAWCCHHAQIPESDKRPGVGLKTLALAEQARVDDSADVFLSQDVFRDLWALAAQYELDMKMVADNLEQVVKDYHRGKKSSPFLRDPYRVKGLRL